MIQDIRRLTKVIGDTKVVGPTTNHGRAANDSGRATFLEWPETHCFIQPLDDPRRRFPWDLDPGDEMSAIASSKRHMETEKVESVADMSDTGLFFREPYSAVAVQHLSNSITQSLCISLGTPRDKHAPVIRITHEPNIRFAGSHRLITCCTVLAFAVQEPVQTV